MVSVTVVYVFISLFLQHTSLSASRSEKGTGWSSRSLGARCRNSIALCSDEQPHIGNYRLLKTIGKGNFAKVKLARHILTGREVSSKKQEGEKNNAQKAKSRKNPDNYYAEGQPCTVAHMRLKEKSLGVGAEVNTADPCSAVKAFKPFEERQCVCVCVYVHVFKYTVVFLLIKPLTYISSVDNSGLKKLCVSATGLIM